MDVELFITEHAQDLSLQQNQQMLQFLNELQRSFQDLVEQTAAQMEALQGHLQQIQQEVQVKVRLNQQLSSFVYGDVFWGFSDRSPMIMNPGTWVYQLQNFMSFQAKMTWPKKELFCFSCFMCVREYICLCANCMCKCFHFSETLLLLCPIVSTAMQNL